MERMYLARATAMTFLVATFAVSPLQSSEDKFNPQQQKKQVSDFLVRPFFDTAVPSNITTQLGGHAYMPCRVKQLGNKSVSWIRRRDSHILTIDWLLFIADDRFRIFLVEPTCTWTIQIKYVQPRDAGVYECQINTSPKMSHLVQLNVVVPKIEILGDSDIHVMEGSSVSLKCVIRQSVRDPDYIFWYQNGKRVLDYGGKGAKVITSERRDVNTMVATLTINKAVLLDSGNYTCQPSNLDSASAFLHVLNGEHPAAIQRGHSSGKQIPIRLLAPLSAVLGLSSSHSARAALLTTAFAIDTVFRFLYSFVV
ncbi:hemicentin-2-like [Daktulosphaira vitifoliae]|uniref:hemicentin-2-like n=1 Tax=Daktulosphaira vitifoliae TaxID=58002 RepID=UPI0021AA9EA0|nr:hemicentin-2-like [Daktulosphaira vitifoliae]